MAYILNWKLGNPCEKCISGANMLVEASKNGHENCLLSLVRKGIGINKLWNREAFIVAARYGRRRCLKILIEAGADVNMTDSGKYSALYHTVVNGNEECVKLLLEAGANIGKHGFAAVKRAVERRYFSCARVILETGADVNCKLGVNGACFDRYGYEVSDKSYLAKIAAERDVQNVKLFLKLGAHVNRKGKNWYFGQWLPESIMSLLEAAGENVEGYEDKYDDGYDYENSDTDGETDSNKDENEDIKIEGVGMKDVNVCVNLMPICRKVIREHLLAIRSMNLFVQVAELKFPGRLASYLLFNESVDL